MSGEHTVPSTGSDPAKTPTLKRALGLSMGLVIVVGNVIGSGIFLKPGAIAAEAGQFGLIMSVWLFGGVLCILGALCFAELATMLPRAGGLYVYLRGAYGQPVAFLFGWMELLLSRPAALGALSAAFIGSLTLALDWRISRLTELVLVLILIGGMAWVNIVGVIWGGRVQMVTTLIKGTSLGLMATAPVLLFPFTNVGIELANYASTAIPRYSGLASQLGAVLLAVMWAYNGWHGITPLTEEIRNPQRTVPRSLFGGIGILILLYISANLAYHGVLTMGEMKASGDHAAEEMLRKLLGPLGLTLMSGVIMCSTFGAINSTLLQASRVPFAMGRDGAFFRALGQVHAKYRTPAVAILVKAILGMTLVMIVVVAKRLVREVNIDSYHWKTVLLIIGSLQNDSIFSLLTNLVIFSASIFYVLGVLAVIVLRYRRPQQERPFKTPGYPLVPVFFVLVYVWFLYQVFIDKPLESLVGILLIVLGIPVYYAYQWSTRDPKRR